jgi:hypothetical protein
MVTELVGHHVVNSYSGELRRIHSYPRTIARLPPACPNLKENILAAGCNYSIPLPARVHARWHCRPSSQPAP